MCKAIWKAVNCYEKHTKMVAWQIFGWLAVALAPLSLLGCMPHELTYSGVEQAMRQSQPTAATVAPIALALQGIERTPDGLKIVLVGSQPFSYTLANHDQPLRLTVDIPDAQVQESIGRAVGQSGVKAVRLNAVPGSAILARLEVDLEDSATYSVSKQQERITVRVKPATQTSPAQPPPHPIAALPPAPSAKPMVGASPGGDYRVGPGDVLAITVYDEPDLTRQVRVSESGILSFPLIGSVEVNNLTTAEIEQRLEEALTPRYLLNPQVFVDVAQFESKKVFIVGAVEQPTTFKLQGETTLLEVLSQTGDLSHSSFLMVFRRPSTEAAEQNSSEREMQTIRVNLDRLLRQGDMSLNMPLQANDVLYIPKPDAVFVFGEVGKTGPVPLPDGGMTLVEAINKAGGFATYAAPKRTRVLRMVDGQERVIEVDMSAVIAGDLRQDIELKANDIVIVPQSVF